MRTHFGYDRTPAAIISPNPTTRHLDLPSSPAPAYVGIVDLSVVDHPRRGVCHPMIERRIVAVREWWAAHTLAPRFRRDFAAPISRGPAWSCWTPTSRAA